MSILHEREVLCPACAHPLKTRIAESVNANRAPHLRDAVRAGTFQHYRCASCEHAFFVDDPFTYIDFARHLWFGVFPSAWESRWASLEEEPRRVWRSYLVESAPPFMKPIADSFFIRTVFGLPALREKVLCIEAGVNDTLLEACKLERMRTEGRISPLARRRLVAIDDATLTFASARQEPAGVLTEVPRTALEPTTREAWLPLQATLVEGPYVDLGRENLDLRLTARGAGALAAAAR